MKRPNRVQAQLAILVFASMAVSLESNLYSIEHQITWNEQPKLAADFSAFYNGAWALLYNPGHVYAQANYPVPYGQTLVYPPNFLLFIIPLLALSFPTAEFVFSALQFALLPLMAALVYLVLKPRSGVDYAIAASVIEIVLLEPFDSRDVGLAIWPQVQQSLPLLVLLPLIPYLAFESVSSKSRKVSILGLVALGLILLWLAAGTGMNGAPNYMVASVPYETQWLLGQSKVLQLTLILLAIWLAGKRPMLSAPVLLLSAFDPRFTLLALPAYLYIIVRHKSVRKFAVGSILAVLVLAVPFVLYYGALEQYVVFVFNNYLSPTGYRRYFTFYFWDYDWLPLYALVAFQAGLALLEILRSKRSASFFGRTIGSRT